jgi:hypothetical protein
VHWHYPHGETINVILFVGKGRRRNLVAEKALRLSVNKFGRFTGARTDFHGRGMPEADKVVKLMMGIA